METKQLQFVSFLLGSEEYCVDIFEVQEIINLPTIKQIPGAPSFVDGIINLRGKIVPIIDFRKRLNLNVTEFTRHTRVVIVQVNNRVIGFIVDMVSGVFKIDEADIEVTPEVVTSVNVEFISGVAKLKDKLIIILDVDKILTSHEQNTLEIMKVEEFEQVKK